MKGEFSGSSSSSSSAVGAGKGKGKDGKNVLEQMNKMLQMIQSQSPAGAPPPSAAIAPYIPPAPPAVVTTDWTCPGCGDSVLASKNSCLMCGTPKAAAMMGGSPLGNTMMGPAAGTDPNADWTCLGCGDIVFASKPSCLMCGTPRTAAIGPGVLGALGLAGGCGCGVAGKGMGKAKGKNGKLVQVALRDWTCPSCGDQVLPTKDKCGKCLTARPVDISAAVLEGRPGDWICPACGNLNLSRMRSCQNCGQDGSMATRMGVKPGDWICPGCGDLVFASRSVCKMCHTEKPNEEDQIAAVAQWYGALAALSAAHAENSGVAPY